MEQTLQKSQKRVFQPWLIECLRQYSDCKAVEYGNRSFTYGDIDRSSNCIARWILRSGIQPQTFIGIYTTDRVQLIEAIIGILKARCVFVPLDPAHPLTRLETLVNSADISIIFTGDEGENRLSHSETLLSRGVRFLHWKDIFEDRAPSPQPAQELDLDYSGEDKIYIYFTSGTTGTPKAIIGKNKSLHHFIEWEIETFSITPGFRISQWITPGFDAFLRDVFTAFCSGGVLCIPPSPDILLSPDDLTAWTDNSRVNLIHCVPSLFRQLNPGKLTPKHFESLKYILLSGERIVPAQLENWYNTFSDRIQLVNLYGPSETTMVKTFYLLRKEDVHLDRIPVGKPMKGTRVIILDENNNVCDPFIPGEIYIRTPFRTHGYYKDDELTRQRFIPNPLNNDREDIVYKTGDMGRFLDDGVIDFLGRKDRQVKIRGVRVELEEIESVLSREKTVKEAAVIKKESGSGSEFLCAYVTLEMTGDTGDGVIDPGVKSEDKSEDETGKERLVNELKENLARVFPAFMVPSHIRLLDEMPRKPNGKIDYDKLPDPLDDLRSHYVPPVTEVQRKLVKLWQEILGIDSIGINHRFFEVGGNSLNLLTLISHIHRDFDTRLKLEEMFFNDTVEKQSALLETAESDPFSSIPAVGEKDHYVLSSVQRRLFFLQHLDPGNMSYNMPRTYILEGLLDAPKIENTFRRLIERHESMRTSFELLDTEPVQKIHKPGQVAFELEYYRLEAGGIEIKVEEKDLQNFESLHPHIETIIKRFIRPFDLSTAPIFRAAIIPLTPRLAIMLLDIHHIIFDGTSQAIFESDFMALYKEENLPPLRIQYKDFAEWLNMPAQKERVQEQEEYWLKRFEGELPLINLPLDYERPQAQDFEGNQVVFDLGIEKTQKLKEFALETDTTLFIVFLSLFNVMLARIAGQEDIILGTSAAGRRHADLNLIMGMFINAVVLRNFPASEKTLLQFLGEVKDNTLKAFENQDYQFEDLVEKVMVERVPGRNPLFDVMMVLNNEEYPEVEIPGLRLGIYPYTKQSAQMDLKLRLIEASDRIYGLFEYSTSVFKEDTVQRFAEYFKTVVTHAPLNPSKKLKEIEIIPQDEKHRLLVEFNDTQRDYPIDSLIHQWIEAQSDRTPGSVAVTGMNLDQDRELSLTYRDLNAKSNRLAHRLRKMGVTPESVVGIMMEPSVDMIIVLLAILKAGGAYLPIEVELPQHRVRFMMEDAQAKILLTTRAAIADKSFSTLRGFETHKNDIARTAPRPPIAEFNRLPIPDRSLIHLGNYKNKIGMASAMDCISLQATRGCPYECLFCHKVWSKRHVFRSAENIFEEVEFYYKKGIRNFAFIDDCFNLNKENSSRFFRLILEKGLKLQIFFPNGLRGDLLTNDYIDLMVEAGTRGINLSLETASPRLQKLLKKNLDIGKFKEVMDYIGSQHPGVILEIATMHGFPTETEEEALMTLDFIKSIRWIHFPYIHILKIYPNTEMEELALAHGVSKEEILASKDLAFHELPETLPFPKSFTREYQSDFMNNYFLLKERLNRVIPVQLSVMGETAAVEKYNTYLPIDIRSLQDIFDFTRLDNGKELIAQASKPIHEMARETDGNFFDQPPVSTREENPGAMRVLFLDLSQHFSSHRMLYNVVEQPLGEIYLLTYLKQVFGSRVSGRIYKAGNDFDSYAELKTLVQDFKPHLIGIRALTFYKEFFHETVSLLRQWGIDVPIVAGGPYATSDYDTILKDRYVDLVVFGEGEYTMRDLVENMLKHDYRLPGGEILQTIPGIAFAQPKQDQSQDNDKNKNSASPGLARTVFLLDQAADLLDNESDTDPEPCISSSNLAYVMYTSGSTGTPKGVMVEHRQVQNCIRWMQDQFNLNANDAVVQRTNLSFDPSVWEIFWPLYFGAKVKVLNRFQRKDAQHLVQLMATPGDIAIMYCPATMVGAMTYVLNLKSKTEQPVLTMPRLIIGAEPISMETVKNFYRYYKGVIVNTYGPTECTINNTYYILERSETRPLVPIGIPIANNQIYILSKSLSLCPIKIPGEIGIAGESVARGYIHNEKKTEEAFIDNPFGPGKLYKSGDIGRWTEDGQVEILGRIDEQVKIRGHRIETGEIENAIDAHGSVTKCLVMARDHRKFEGEVQTCKKCGIGTNYPNVRINNDGICEACENLAKYKRFFNRYFKNLHDLKKTILEAKENAVKRGDTPPPYDCLIMYAGGRGAAYALYTLVGMGLKVLAATYDNGYFSSKDIENIKKITDSVGVDHVVFTHPNSSPVLKESVETAHTVCRGCFHMSSSLGVEYAYNHNIPAVIGATLSRGQIIENKLVMFYGQGIDDLQRLEEEVTRVQRSAPDVDKKTFDLIGIDIVKDRSAYTKVKTLDFYRYCDISNEDMTRYLNDRDPYWKTRKNYAIYSTNCSIKQIGDFGHLKGAGFHYYGSATSWERRLGHITLHNFKEDLNCSVTRQGYENFIKRVNAVPKELTQRDEKYLAAYYTSDPQLDPIALRDFLKDKLPPYMIPSYFVTMDEMPLLPNGKVDKKKLPLPEFQVKSDAEYVRPSNEIEEVLADVWHQVLRIPKDRVGIDDNFFELGGDSIKAIQITARLQNQKLKLNISQLFLNPTIRQLAACVQTVQRRIPQEPIEGPVPLTPIQHWFFERNFSHPHHYNQSVMLYRLEGFDPAVVRTVFTRILQHHDALRMVFSKPVGESGQSQDLVRQFNQGIEPGNETACLEVHDLKNHPHFEETIPQLCERIQSGMDLQNGPIFKAALFQTPQGDHLLIAVHHLVIDGVSWRILFEDFETGYIQALQGLTPKFQDKTDSFKYWADQLALYADQDQILQELDYWKQQEEKPVIPLPRSVSSPVPASGRTLGNSKTAVMELDEERTLQLMTAVHHAFNTEINDILLAGLGLAVHRWAGFPYVSFILEGHGREDIIEDVNISRTVGWFTSQFPVILGIDEDIPLSETIKQTKETLRRIPHKGIGYGILRYLTSAAKKQDILFGPDPEIRFNYMGQMGGNSNIEKETENQKSNDNESNTGALYDASPLAKGAEISPLCENRFTIDINGSVSGGILSMTFLYNTYEFTPEHIGELAELYRSSLEQLIDFCMGRDETEMTASDFDAQDLDEEEMNAIYDELDLS